MKKVIILLGPTGVGKSGAAIRLATDLGSEIISADSMQIYRFMDIGTAKPSPEELRAVRHHMIDIMDPAESYSAGQYIAAVVPVIEGLHQQGRVPIVVGGTGLYIRAMTRGIFAGPSANWALREELLSSEELLPGSLYSYLERIDPPAAARIERNDTRRVIRALEVCLSGGGRISALQEVSTKPLPYDFIKIGLTMTRERLYRMIDDRVDVMVKAGLVEEVKHLISRSPGKTALQAIGYREMAAYLEGDVPLAEAVRLIKRNSRRYAKRQFTWFRKEEGITWVDLTGCEDAVRAFQAVNNAVMARLSGSGAAAGAADPVMHRHEGNRV
jgi:tRNA dimethylallyltransferase